MQAWLEMFNVCHRYDSGVHRTAWPDGGSYLDQDNMTVVIFSVIEEQVSKVMQKKAKSAARRGKRG